MMIDTIRFSNVISVKQKKLLRNSRIAHLLVFIYLFFFVIVCRRFSVKAIKGLLRSKAA